VKKNDQESIDQRLVHALAHPMRVQILEILSDRVASPIGLSAELGTSLSHVAYHTRTLDDCGCLQLVGTEQRRGGTEHFYKAAPDSFIGSREWRQVPKSVRAGVTAASLQTFMDKAVAALEAGTIDDRDDTTLSWMPVRVDDEGWREVTEILREASERVLAAESRSRARLGSNGKRSATSAVVALANFETPGSAPSDPA
jgi:DNA-binding transcriptional ArsR family regulator